jgi:hypothetical protein
MNGWAIFNRRFAAFVFKFPPPHFCPARISSRNSANSAAFHPKTGAFCGKWPAPFGREGASSPDFFTPPTLRVAGFLCGAVLGVMGHDAAGKLSEAWGWFAPIPRAAKHAIIAQLRRSGSNHRSKIGWIDHDL